MWCDDGDVNFRKNLPAKLATIGASAAALFGFWAVVRQQTPASDAADAQTGAAPTAPAPVRPAASSQPQPRTQPAPAPRRHTRTHAS
jgi:hypothetical protein